MLEPGKKADVIEVDRMQDESQFHTRRRKSMGEGNYLIYPKSEVRTWMEQVIRGIDNQETHFFLEETGYTWTVWGLAQAANAHFDFSTGDAEPEIVSLAREVLGPKAPMGTSDED